MSPQPGRLPADDIDDKLWAAAIGPGRFDYYRPRFARFEQDGISASWHWGAFFVTLWWLIYRKLWLPAFLYWAAWFPITFLDMAAESAGFPPLFTLLAVITVFTLVPMYANALYFHQLRKKIRRIREEVPDEPGQLQALARAGGTSKLIFLLVFLVLLGLLGIVGAVVIPAFQDYTAREQVSEGIELTYRFKTDLAQYHAGMRTFAGLDTTALGYDIAGNYVESVTFVDAGDAAIAVVATFRTAGVLEPVRGREFRIATTDGGATWECGAAIKDPVLRGENQVPARLLPTQCR